MIPFGVAVEKSHAHGDAHAELARASHALAGLDPPTGGEIDIGDIRFGSTIEEAREPEHVTQPQAMTQQIAGAVGVVELLRTDMNPVVGDAAARA